MSDCRVEFINFMRSVGCEPVAGTEIFTDDKKRRYVLEGTRSKKTNASYKLKTDGDFSVGWCRSFKEGITHSWHSKSKRKFTPDEKAAWTARRKTEKQAQDKAEAESYAAAAKRANAIWQRSVEKGNSPYFDRKKVTPEGVRFSFNLIVIPTYIDGAISTLQFISPEGEKRFLKEGKKEGSFCPLGFSPDMEIIAVVEGWATGRSVRMATGLPVAVAFDAGNLALVGKNIRKQWPAARIIFCGDDDKFKDDFSPSKANTGVEKAKAAVLAIGNAVAVFPEFEEKAEINGKPAKDFNDAHILYGLDAVKNRILSALAPSEEAPDEFPPSVDDMHLVGGDFSSQLTKNNLPFTVLGFDDGKYYYLPRSESQIVELRAYGHTMQNLLRLAPKEYWEDVYPDCDSHSDLSLAAQDDLMAMCRARGVFRPEVTVRGCGGWRDNGRAVFNSGDHLWIDGEKNALYNFSSKFTYIRSLNIGDPLPALDNTLAHKLREICEMPSWENKLSGALLAGWCVIAPVCSMLKWRPHIWITGMAEAGKSTVIEDIIQRLLGQMIIKVDGGTTEAGLRQSIKYDGLAVLFDEAEGESDKARGLMEDVLQFVRKSSSGGYVLKGSVSGQATRFPCRSAFCFSAINPPVKHLADDTRISMLVIKKDTSSQAAERYKNLMLQISEVLTPDYGQRLLGRTLKNFEVLLKNIDIFKITAAEILGSRRAADQIAPMLAGLYLLHTTKLITPENAHKWISEQDWMFHTATTEMKDHERLLQFLSTQTLRVTVLSQQRDVSIGTLILCAAGKDNYCPPEDANRALRSIGIKIKGECVLFANVSAPLSSRLKTTPWAGKYSRTLCDIDGSVKTDAEYFSPGLKSRATGIPLRIFLEDKLIINQEENYDIQF
jgi:putative DNA primase/helicase